MNDELSLSIFLCGAPSVDRVRAAVDALGSLRVVKGVELVWPGPGMRGFVRHDLSNLLSTSGTAEPVLIAHRDSPGEVSFRDLCRSDHILLVHEHRIPFGDGLARALETALVTGADVLVCSDGLRRNQRVLDLLKPGGTGKDAVGDALFGAADLLISKNALHEFHAPTEDAPYSLLPTVAALCAAAVAGAVSPGRLTSFFGSAEAVRGQQSLVPSLVRAWRRAEELSGEKKDALRSVAGAVLVRRLVTAMIWGPRGWTSREIGDFLRPRLVALLGAGIPPRHARIIETAVLGNDVDLAAELRPRLLVAGHDLKFARPILGPLSGQIDVKMDEWTGHTLHDVAESERCLEWADLLWCEWMLGSAAWYSTRAAAHQVLMVRCHRAEIRSHVGDGVDISRVDRFIAVSPHTLNDFVERFGLPRSAVSLIRNVVDGGSLATRVKEPGTDPTRLLMVGAVPRLKGLHRVLNLLAALRDRDPNYRLTVVGRTAEELDWIGSDPEERDYADYCRSVIRERGLEGAVLFRGWADMRQEYANHDILVAASEHEGFHVSSVEAMAAGVVPVIRRWHGADESFPEEFLVDDDELVDAVWALRDSDMYERASRCGMRFAGSGFAAEAVASRLLDDARQIALDVTR